MSGTQDIEEENKITTEPWGKLVSLNKSKANNYDLHLLEITMGRNPTNTIVIDDNRLSGVHCKITFNPDTFVTTITDLSTNGTFISDSKIGKGIEVTIKPSDEIYLLHKTKVPAADTIGFAFFMNKQKEVVAAKPESKIMDTLGEDFHCPICDDLIYQAVTLMPCLHNFCGSCFSDWMAKQKNCPTCRKDVQIVNRNASINNVIEKYLQSRPELKRPVEEYKAMDENNKIKADMITFKEEKEEQKALIDPPGGRGRGRGRGALPVQPVAPAPGRIKRQVSDYSASSEDDDRPTRDCITCKAAVDGFECKKRGQVHVQCRNCQSRMPKLNPTDNTLVHQCTLCQQDFCTVYNKNCERLSKINPNRQLKDHIPPNVDLLAFRQNQQEFKYFQDFMRAQDMTSNDILKYMLEQHISKREFHYVINKRTDFNPIREQDILVLPETPFCVQCFLLVWRQIVFRFRIANKHRMGNEVMNRVNCYYGVNCKTQLHNPDHAKKLDHMCEQTKF